MCLAQGQHINNILKIRQQKQVGHFSTHPRLILFPRVSNTLMTPALLNES